MDWLTVNISDYLLRHTVERTNSQELAKPEYRKRVAYLEAWISIIGNIFLAVIKIVFGLMLNSISMLADAVHTASDVSTSLVGNVK